MVESGMQYLIRSCGFKAWRKQDDGNSIIRQEQPVASTPGTQHTADEQACGATKLTINRRIQMVGSNNAPAPDQPPPARRIIAQPPQGLTSITRQPEQCG